MSLGSVQAAQRPSLMLSPSSAVFPQATIEEYTPRNSFRVSVQSLQQKGQPGPHINIPLMFFTPATPQVNNSSPTSPASPTSQNGDIYGYYGGDSAGPDNGIGVAQSSIDERTTSPTPYDPTNNDHNLARTPSPYSVNASQASPHNYGTSRSPEPRNPTPGFDISTDASSRVSSPSPSRPAGAGLHMPPRYTPYASNAPTSTAPPPPVPSSQEQTPQSPEVIDMSAAPVTINRANSNAWRLSVERAADRAMDKVRTAASAATTSTPGFAQVPEEEERLTKSDLANTVDNDSRGRRKKRNQSQGAIAYGSTNTTPTKHDTKLRSGSIGASRSPSGRRTSNGAGGYARRSSSLGGYRNRHNSLSYNQIDGVPKTPRRNSRRGSNSSSVMMI
ncbi:uncharacterized protein DFL_005661 [Arthrobotrys flagrans]|uniref:Uncharacterized protein n=1 Tax=Arthrobotrys flagrans TaxID=97331 RepID=A0A436ZYH1_ARTFL|nr:hypothetical protein DFL_005661 [Arthrobotrys flagrans]